MALAREGDLTPEEAILEVFDVYYYYFFNEKEQSLGKKSRDDPRWQARLQAVSVGKHCLSPSAKVFSRPHPTLTTYDFVAVGMSRADGTLQKKRLCRMASPQNLQSVRKAPSPVGELSSPLLPSKGLYMCIKFASDLKQK